MTIVLIGLLLFVLITSRIVKENEEYLSKDYTNTIKGIFLIFVFISHFISYQIPLNNGYIDTIGVKIIRQIGQLMVTLFLFYSGYGIMESIKKKGIEYVKGMPKKRLLTTWIHFAIAVLIYMIATKYFIYHEFSLKKTVLALIGWDGFGNSNWYIFCIIILYFITYLSARAFKNNRNIVISVFLGTVLFTVIMSLYKEDYWYNTAFCYSLGLLYSTYKEKIEDFLKNGGLLVFIYSLIIFLLTYKFNKNTYVYYIYTLTFTMLVVLITRKVQIKNPALKWLGKNLFPMYIFQRLPMILLYDV